MNSLPELGVALVYFPALEPLLKAGSEWINAIEIEPQSFWIKRNTPTDTSGHTAVCYELDERAFARIEAWPQRKILHGIGIPVGGSLSPDPTQLSPFLRSIERLNPPWVSEHLAFIRATHQQGPYHTGFLLPPLQTADTLAYAVQHIRQLKSYLPVPFAFENAVNYLRPIAGEMPDGVFLAAVAEQADCGILLDLHNLWCNQLNGRDSVTKVLNALPLERVWEIHLAGGDAYQNYWLDAHSGLVPDILLAICSEYLPRMPNLKAITFEIIPEYISAKSLSIAHLLNQIKAIHQLWQQRNRSQYPLPCYTPLKLEKDHTIYKLPIDENTPTPVEWEHTLGQLVNRRKPETRLALQLNNDPGVFVLQALVHQVRAGMLVDLLCYSYRLLVLQLGQQQVHQIFENYWQEYLPEPFAAEEAKRFCCFLKNLSLSIAHLNEVLDYEVQSLEVISSGNPSSVIFSCDPTCLIAALKRGEYPEALPLGRYELHITP